MIYYNKKVAELLKENGVGILRRHKEPDMKRLELYESYSPELKLLAFSSAEPCLASETNTVHYGLGKSVYCHATSPLRRYADLVNQRLLKDLITNSDSSNLTKSSQTLVDHLKRREKELKAYEHTLFFLENILDSQNTTIPGLVIDVKNYPTGSRYGLKLRIWVKSWNRVIAWKTHGHILPDSGLISIQNIGDKNSTQNEIRLGQTINLSWYVNMNMIHWSDRIVFRLV
jgi:exoribonuclease R